MTRRLKNFAAISSLIIAMGLGASAMISDASAKTTSVHKQTVFGTVIVAPKVVSGTKYKMTVEKGGKSYVVSFDTSSAKVVNHKGSSIAVDKIAVGNKVHVRGTVDASAKTITSTIKVKDESIK